MTRSPPTTAGWHINHAETTLTTKGCTVKPAAQNAGDSMMFGKLGCWQMIAKAEKE